MNTLFIGDAKPFAEHGFEKMLYDARMGPVALVHKDVLYVAYGGSKEDGFPRPNLVTYDIKSGKWSKPIRPDDLDILSPNHHFNPIIWMDPSDRLHMLYQTHCSEGIHIYATKPGGIESWTRGPAIASNITYPRMLKLPDGRLLMYYRVFGHMGYWTYILSSDGGFSWSKPRPLIDFDQNPVLYDDEWAGSYHSVAISRDGKSLHLGFVYFHERGMYSWKHPIYKERPGVRTRFHLYYAKADIETGRLTTINGDLLPTPLDKASAEACKIWDTGLMLTNIPSILLDKNDEPSFLLPVSTEEAMWKCYYWYVFRHDGKWIKAKICPTNSTWSGSCIYRDESGRIVAYVIGTEIDGSKLSYGGGDVQRWSSADGFDWVLDCDVVPEKGLLYNNPMFPEKSDGSGPDTRFVLMFGWEGPESLAPATIGPSSHLGEVPKLVCRGKAFAAMDNKWI